MKIAILGGGISGLAAAWKARRRFPDAFISLHEKAEKLGGWIESTQMGPFLFERGPRTFLRSRSKHLLQLIDEVGLSSKILISEAKPTRYIWTKGKLRPVSSFWPLIFAGVLRDLTLPANSLEEETVASFFSRRFGRRFAEQLVDPFITGVFGGSSSKLSAQACFPKLTQNRSVVLTAFQGPKKVPGLFTLNGGLEQIVEPLSKVVDDLHLNSSLTHLPNADLLISALPAFEISSFLGIPLKIPYERFEVVNLGFHRSGLLPEGYGYLVPSFEKEPVMGMLWDSAIFPPHDQTRVTVMVRSLDPIREARRALEEHLQIRDFPDAVLVKTAFVPQYEIGHKQRVFEFFSKAKQIVPHLSFCGNWIEGPSVDQCIETASSIKDY